MDSERAVVGCEAEHAAAHVAELRDHSPSCVLIVGQDDLVMHVIGAGETVSVFRYVGQNLEASLPVSRVPLFREQLARVRADGRERDVRWRSARAAFPGDIDIAGCRRALLAAGCGREDPVAIALSHDEGCGVDDGTMLRQELKQAREQLFQSEKMAAVGQLAAGVAHEINNPVGFVISNLGSLTGYVRDLLKIVDSLDGGASIAELIEMRTAIDYDFLRQDIESLLVESEDGLDRIKKIIAALKDFTHKEDEEFRPADINKGISTTLKVANSELKYKADVVTEFGDIPMVECAMSQINQVIMNLLVNSAHAMTTFGKISVRTLRESDMVVIEVEDNGAGIPPEIKTRIFEPFFTTKPVGKGTGLGLALSYNIVRAHSGRIEVESTPGVGTRFRIWLPISQSDDGNSMGNLVKDDGSFA